MKQTLTELSEILKQIDKGAKWDHEVNFGFWMPGGDSNSVLHWIGQGSRIRLKPAAPDADGWIEWKGGECPVDGRSVVEIKTGIGTVSKRTADTLRWRWDWSGTGSDIVAYRIHKEPEPDPHAEIKAAFERGEAVEMRCLNHALPKYRSWHCWADWEGVIQADWEYRLEPEPEYILLGPEDVPPGSALRQIGCFKTWSLVTGTADSGTICRRGHITEWYTLEKECQINRSLPLTGKWDPEAWEPCRKLKGGDNE